MAILRPRDIRPMAMSLVTDSDSFNEGIVRSKVLAILSDIRAFQLQYNQNSLSVHSLRANVSVQKDSIQKYARILHKVIQKRKDVFQSLARARAEYEGEVSTQCQLREELTQLRGMVWIAFSSTIHAQIFGVAARNSHHTAQNTSQYATLCLDLLPAPPATSVIESTVNAVRNKMPFDAERCYQEQNNALSTREPNSHSRLLIVVALITRIVPIYMCHHPANLTKQTILGRFVREGLSSLHLRYYRLIMSHVQSRHATRGKARSAELHAEVCDAAGRTLEGWGCCYGARPMMITSGINAGQEMHSERDMIYVVSSVVVERSPLDDVPAIRTFSPLSIMDSALYESFKARILVDIRDHVDQAYDNLREEDAKQDEESNNIKQSVMIVAQQASAAIQRCVYSLPLSLGISTIFIPLSLINGQVYSLPLSLGISTIFIPLSLINGQVYSLPLSLGISTIFIPLSLINGILDAFIVLFIINVV
ncbi:uncharacterized protein LACBIDRAFT_335109 [Laccaria bicolor S238N-H82]|uniref:Predicted protein n=1 Tax=Laccaria bicolor (strain S238N-H82 / ATCC MYA-4686) TaxID=486041 RepID=B0E1E1_LACBS|nr:uncharacterized protein LACBIDRAFT_335109 [Laccaria bicolor S238N-H82]EDQ99365.1 predicted protein [Laccaria bicolor S238N-H82]|eukprot:XP_001890011.1 predicted protein [Laccaria bicolor S238N-H82]